jgi:release factor glutamine methyltransferase
MTLHLSGSIAECLRIAAEDLCDAGEAPRRDAEVLLCDVLACDRTYLFAYGEKILTEKELEVFRRYIDRRKAGEPVAYILGKREFWSLLLRVNNSTLIPRPDTEVLVETALQYCKQDRACVIDLGTGTGAIALALASEKPDWQIDAVDAHDDAVALATLNARELALKNVHVYRSNWFADVHASTAVPDALFDMVISNPPYIAAADHHLDCGDLRFEPHSALVAADDGYADLFAIAEQARDFLCDNGFLLLEHGFAQAEKMRNYLQQLGYANAQTIRDYAGHERVTLAWWQDKRA